MANVDSLEALLHEELKDIYDAEKQLTRALPKMIKKASFDQLRQTLEQHLQETGRQVKRLDQVFEALNLPARAKKCVGMRNLIAEADEMIGEAEDEATRDAVMIAAAQKVEHYEIATYGTLRTWAKRLGHTEAVSLLEETLDEEKAADQKLTEVAESFVNEAAASQSEEAEESTERAGRGQSRSARASTSRAGRAAAADRRRRK